MGQAKRRKQARQSGTPWPCDAWGDVRVRLSYMPDDGEDRDLVADMAEEHGITSANKLMLSAFDVERKDGSRLAVVIGIGEHGKASPMAQMALNRAQRRHPDFKEIHIIQMSDLDTAPACVAWHVSENPDTVGRIVVFACPTPKMVDRVSCPLLYDRPDVALYADGKRLTISPESRQRGREYAREWYGESRGEQFTEAAQTVTMDWTFEVEVDGVSRRVLVVNGLWGWSRIPGASELRKVGASEICIAQINSPVEPPRSAVRAAKTVFATGCDGAVLWARNKEIYNSIVSEFVAAGYLTAPDLDLPEDWKADRVVMFPCKEGVE